VNPSEPSSKNGNLGSGIEGSLLEKKLELSLSRMLHSLPLASARGTRVGYRSRVSSSDAKITKYGRCTGTPLRELGRSNVAAVDTTVHNPNLQMGCTEAVQLVQLENKVSSNLCLLVFTEFPRGFFTGRVRNFSFCKEPAPQGTDPLY
jgi:hypothetical protein